MKPNNEEFTGLINGIADIVKSPVFQGMLDSQRQAEANRQFNEKLKKYEEKRYTLTDEEKDKLVLAVGSGNNTYKDICEILPEMNPATLMQYLWDDPPRESETNYYFNQVQKLGIPRLPSLIRFAKVPEDFQELYQFKEADRFYLTVTGENMLYYLKKELVIKQEAAHQEELAAKRHKELRFLNILAILVSLAAVIVAVLKK